MSKTQEQILKAETAHEVFVWLKEDASHQTPEVFAYLDKLRKKEFETSIPDYDPNIHYDLAKRK